MANYLFSFAKSVTLFLAVFFCVLLQGNAQTSLSTNGLDIWYSADQSILNGSSLEELVNVAHPGDLNAESQPSYYFPPSFVASFVNSKPAVDFDGVNDFLEIGCCLANNSLLNNPSTEKSLFFVFQANDVDLLSADERVIFDQGGINDGMSVYISGGVLYFNVHGRFPSPWQSYTSTPVIANQLYVCTMVMNTTGKILEIYLNGELKNSLISPTIQDFNLQTTAPYYDYNSLGSSYGNIKFANGTTEDHTASGLASANFFDGYILEFLYYNNVLTTQERKQTEAYLLSKYSLAPLYKCLSCLEDEAKTITWLKADEVGGSLSNTDPVESWTDISGNNMIATNAVVVNQPVYGTSVINSKPAVQFDGTRFLTLPTTNMLNVEGNAYTDRSYSFVLKTSADVTSRQVIYKEGDELNGLNLYVYGGVLYFQLHRFSTLYQVQTYSTSILANQSYIISFVMNSSNLNELFINGEKKVWSAYNNIVYTPGSSSVTLGATEVNGTYFNDCPSCSTSVYGFTGAVSDVLIMDKALTTFERAVWENDFSLKYNIVLYQDRYRWQADFVTNMGGVGMESMGGNNTSCSDILEFSQDNTTDNLLALIAHDDASLSTFWTGYNANTTDNVSKNIQRTERTWRVDITQQVTGNFSFVTTSKNINYAVKISNFPAFPTLLSYQKRVLVVDHDGDFKTDSKVYELETSTDGLYYKVDNVPVQAGDHITLGVINQYEYLSTYNGQEDFIGKINTGVLKTTLLSHGVTLTSPVSLSNNTHISIARENTSAPERFAGYLHYYAFGINGNSLTYKWKVNEYGETGLFEMQFDPTLYEEDAVLASPYEYVLLVDKTGTGTFDQFSTILSFTYHQGKYRVFNLNLNEGDIFTIAKIQPPTLATQKLKDVLKESLGELSAGYANGIVLNSYTNPGFQSGTPCTQTLDKATLYLTLNTGDNYLFGATAFTTSLDVDVYGRTSAYDGAPVQKVLLGTCTLTLDQSKPEQLHIMDVSSYYNAYTFKELYVYPSTGTFTAPTTAVIANALELRAEVKEEKRTLVPITPTSLVTTQQTQFINEGGADRACLFTWLANDDCKPYSYEFQLLRLYNRGTNLGDLDSDESKMYNAELDWSKALSIETKEETLTLTLAEGTGYYIWRVRPIGNYYEGGIANNQNWGNWSGENITSPLTILPADVASYNGAVFYYTQFDEDKNFIYNRVFTEDTKIHEGISYANGLQQGTQTQSRVPSNGTEGQVIVSNTVQDLSGRPVVQTLPTPDLSGDNLLGYRSSALMQAADNSAFTPFDFDVDNPLDNTMINLYYSNVNTDPQIPNAEDYAYSRVVQSNDGLNRVVEQSGVGATHKIGGKTVKITYSAATEVELIRLFGDEAPKSNTVLKTITTDQNDITSITYTDMSGKVIATSLLPNEQSATGNLDPLDIETYTVVELLDNNIYLDDHTVEAAKPFVFTEPTEVTVEIVVTPSHIESDCGFYCATCAYKATIKITDVNNPLDPLTNKEETATIGGSEVPCPGENGADITKTMVITLPAGKYIIKKIISVDEDAASIYATSVTQKIQTEIKEFIDDEILSYITLPSKDVKGLNLNLQAFLTGTKTAPDGFVITVDRGKPDDAYDPITNPELKDGDKVTVATSCCSVTVPIMFPVILPCEEFIEIPVPNYDGFAAALVYKYKEAYGITGDLTITHNELGTYTEEDFKELIKNMLIETDALGAPMYQCSKIWDCWNTQIILAKRSNDPAVNGHTSSTPKGLPSWLTPGIINSTSDASQNPIEQFLTCAGRHLKGYWKDNSPTGGAVLRRYAYKLFYYNRPVLPYVPTAGQTACENVFCKVQPDQTADPCTLLACEKDERVSPLTPNYYTLWFKSTTAVFTDLLEDEYFQLYGCLRTQTLDQNTLSGILPPTFVDIMAQTVAQKKTLDAQCNTACGDKRDEFLAKLRKLYDADGDGIYLNEQNESVSVEDLCCTADRLVDYCKDQCNLSLLRVRCDATGINANDPVKLVDMGTMEEKNTLISILYGTFELEDAANTSVSCGTNFRKVASCYDVVGIYHLNGLADLADEAHASNSAYNITYNGSSFTSGRLAATGTAMDAGTSASCTSEPGDRGITKNVTVSAWVKMNTITNGTEKIIARKLDANAGFKLYSKNGFVYFDVVDNGTLRSSGASMYSIETGVPTVVTEDPLMEDQRWHLVTGVCRDTIVEIWVDGEYQNGMQLTSGVINTISTNADFEIGATSNGFEGEIDEVYLYACALGKGAILQQYKDTKGENLVYSEMPVGSSNCATTVNQVPDKLWDRAAGDWTDMAGVNKVSTGKIWSYGSTNLLSNPLLVILDEKGNKSETVFQDYPSSKFTDMISAHDGNYYLAGHGNNIGILYKLDIYGNIIWHTSVSSPFENEYGRVVKIIEYDEHVYLMNHSASSNTLNLFKIDKTGLFIDYKSYSIDAPMGSGAFQFLSQSNFHLMESPSVLSTVILDNNFLYVLSKGSVSDNLMKIDLNSTLSKIDWQKIILKNNGWESKAIHLIDDNKKIVLLGTETILTNGAYHSVAKILNYETSIGDLVWSNTWAPSDNLIGTDNTVNINYSTVTKGDNIAFCGNYKGYTTTGTYSHAYMVRFNKNQEYSVYIPDNTVFPNTPDLQVQHAGQTAYTLLEINSGFYLVGKSNLDYGVAYQNNNQFLIKLNSNLNFSWRKTIETGSYLKEIEWKNSNFFLTELSNKSILLSQFYGSNLVNNNDRGGEWINCTNDKCRDSWFLTLGYPVTCANRPICIKWKNTPTVTVYDPEPVDPTPVVLIITEITKTILTQLANCENTNLVRLEAEYLAKCKGKIIDTTTVEYDVKSGHYTLYYYDRAGNLVATVPPEGVELLSPYDGSGNPNQSVLDRQVPTAHRMKTKYQYNSLGQLVWQETPDGDITNFIYNKLGMLRYSQNAKQFAASAYSYTKYDELGRIIEVGEASEAITGVAFAALDNPIYLDGTTSASTAFGHTAYPTTGTAQETFTVYTDAASHLNYLGVGQKYLRNRVSYTFTNSLKGEKAVTCYSYDPHGNVNWIVQDVPGFARNTIGYDYDLISNKVLQVKFNEKRSDQFFHRYSYDTDNRITLVETSTNGYLWDRDAAYQYYKHGPLRRTEIGEDHVQGLDYTYTIQGWLKGVNAPSISPTADPGLDGNGSSMFMPDEYGFTLGYYNGDFNRTGSVFNSTSTYALNSTKPLYNGNITSWTTRINADDQGAINHAISGSTYTYDWLNRIRESNYVTYNAGAYAGNSDEYKTTYTYDGNGNLQFLTRNADGGTVMDNLDYNYDLTGGKKTNNLLRSVSDAVPSSAYDDIDNQSSNNYTYDGIGNLITDQAENVNISWNVYGKVSEVKRTTPTASTKPELRFVYDASGNRIAKELNKNPYNGSGVPQRLPADIETSYYIRDASGNVMAIYERKNVATSGNYFEAIYTLKEVPIYGSSRVGQVDNKDVAVEVGRKIFHKDDLDKVQLDFLFVTEKTENENWITSANTKDIYLIDGNTVNLPRVSLHKVTHTAGAMVPAAIANIQDFAGELGNDITVAEDYAGQVLFYAANFETYWGKNNVLLLFDADGNIMPNSGGINADAKSRSVVVASPGKDKQYVLFTRGADKKMYSHTIDLSLKGNGNSTTAKGDVVDKNNLLDNLDTYGGHMVAIENRATGNAYVYATRYKDPAVVNTGIGTIDIVLFEVSVKGPTTVKKPAVMCANIPSWRDLGESEMQVSSDGKKIILYNHLKNKGWFGHQRSEIVMYNMGADYRLSRNYVVDAERVEAGYTMPNQSADFASNSRFIYYGSDRLVLTGTTPTDKELSRYDIRNAANEVGLYKGVNGDVRRAVTNYVLAENANTTTMPAYTDDANGISSNSLTNNVNFSYLVLADVLTGTLPMQNHMIYGGTTESTTFDRVVNRKNYELNDHLGNVTVVVGDLLKATIAGSTVTNQAWVKTFTNYYAFGMAMPGRTYNDYRYGFNGKEKDTEGMGGGGSTYDYGFRIYNPQIAKFLSVDPLTKEYPWYTPYQFAGNKPIENIDRDGLEESSGQAHFDRMVGNTIQGLKNDYYTYKRSATNALNTLGAFFEEGDLSKTTSSMWYNVTLSSNDSKAQLGDDSKLPKPNPKGTHINFDMEVGDAMTIIKSKLTGELKPFKKALVDMKKDFDKSWNDIAGQGLDAASQVKDEQDRKINIEEKGETRFKSTVNSDSVKYTHYVDKYTKEHIRGGEREVKKEGEKEWKRD